MAMINTLATAETSNLTKASASMAVVVHEIPVVIKPVAIAANFALTQYYQTLRVEGFSDLLPEQIELDPTPIANGGEIRVDQVALPPCCEVIGVWFANPVVCVEKVY